MTNSLFLQKALERPLDKPVAILGNKTIFLRQFLADVTAASSALSQDRKEVGLLYTKNAYWGAVGLFAMAQHGLQIIVPQNSQSGALGEIAAQYRIAVVDESASKDVGLSSAQNSLLLRHADMSENREPVSFGKEQLQTQIQFFTSGSSGSPKRIFKSFGDLINEVIAVDGVFSKFVPEAVPVLGTVNHQHAYGMTFRLMWPLLTGRLIHSDIFEYSESLIAALLPRAVVVTSPAHLDRLDGVRPVKKTLKPSLVLSAGGRLKECSAKMAETIFGTPVTDIYGSTEAGAVAFRSRKEDETPWRAFTGIQIKQNTASELQAIADHIPPEGQVSADRIELFSDGSFQLLGRSDHLLKIEGKRVDIQEIQRGLCALNEVCEAVIISLPESNSEGRPTIAAVVVPSRDGWDDLKQKGTFRFGRYLRMKLATRYEPAGLPRRWRFISEMPTGHMGKISYDKILELFTAGGGMC